MKIEKNDINTDNINNKVLLDELANDISKKYGIEKRKAKELIKYNTLSGIDSLKIELKNEKQLLSNNDLEELFFSIKGAVELVRNSSKIEIKTLKEDIEKTINIDEFKNNLENFLPPNLIEKAKNANKPHEHILGFALGSANSMLTTVEYLYKIGKGIIFAPYHIFMIISGKAESDSFKEI